MKKTLISIVILFLASTVVFSQEYKREGKQFASISQPKEKSENVVTGYTWKESNGSVHDIYITKNNACYIKKVSKKTGKEYRKYLPKEVAAEIAKELGR